LVFSGRPTPYRFTCARGDVPSAHRFRLRRSVSCLTSPGTRGPGTVHRRIVSTLSRWGAGQRYVTSNSESAPIAAPRSARIARVVTIPGGRGGKGVIAPPSARRSILTIRGQKQVHRATGPGDRSSRWTARTRPPLCSAQGHASGFALRSPMPSSTDRHGLDDGVGPLATGHSNGSWASWLSNERCANSLSVKKRGSSVPARPASFRGVYVQDF
jgi:hypothetical protein